MTEPTDYPTVEPSDPAPVSEPNALGLVVVPPDPDAAPGRPGYRGSEVSERLAEAMAKRADLRDD